MQVSVVIVNYNVRHFLHQCLLSVQAALQGMTGEIIVVDNASSDDSHDMMQQYFPEVKWIGNSENVGFSKANNQGVAIASGKYILILNPDTIISEDTLRKLYAFAEENPQKGGIGVPLYDGTGAFLPESKRNIPTIWVSLLKMLGKSESYYASQVKEQESGIVSILAGAFMWIEKSKYDAVGGFDEDYFMYGEDIDLSYKLLQKGYSNYYLATTPIIHYKGESTLKNNAYLKNFYGAMQIFYSKHFPVNYFYDLFIRLGIRFWQVLNYFRMQPTITQNKLSTPILYIGSENEVFEQLRQKNANSEVFIFAVCETRVISRFDDLDKIKKMISEKGIREVVFDHQNNPYSKIIFYMIQLSALSLTFKIHPAKSDFLIGSDSKKRMGSIIKLR